MTVHKITLSVELGDGSRHTATADMHDLRMWEAYAVKNRLPHQADQAPQITYMTFLAYNALRRAGAVSGSFDQFEAVSIDAEGSESVDPTRPAASSD